MKRRALLAVALLSPVVARAQYPSPSGTLPEGLRLTILARWGDRVTYDATPFDPARLTPGAAEAQFGRDARVVGLLPAPQAADGVPRATLIVAHPFGPLGTPELSGAIQGASILNLERQAQGWIIVDGGFQSRRLTATTLTRDSDGTATTGVVGLTGGCVTPWGTVLLCEGDAAGAAGTLALPADAHGHLLEFDPQDPASIPARRRALGRLGATHCAAGMARDGRAAVFFAARGALWRFLSEADAQAPDTLDRGQLSVARLDGESLRWAPATPTTIAAGFTSNTPLALAPNGSRLYAAVTGRRRLLIEIAFAQDDPAAETATVLPLLDARDPPAPAVTPPGPGPAAFPHAPVSLSTLPGGGLLLGAAQANPWAPGGYWRVATDTARRGAVERVWIAPEGAAGGGGVVTPDGGTLIAAFSPPVWRDPSVTGTWPDFSATMPPRGGLVAVTRANGRPFED